ncbi:uncharacterized protein LOC124775895 [Schistocerca piceifrons]|uniref:uncharacterized protein LOC124775895 n=1 Tax=Schistocerca piceifrons TaxID=274613 RepID=UPI001F5EDEBF|nr:uncharacterized protein LOC124775895 [Schistocerca piceifrons]
MNSAPVPPGLRRELASLPPSPRAAPAAPFLEAAAAAPARQLVPWPRMWGAEGYGGGGAAAADRRITRRCGVAGRRCSGVCTLRPPHSPGRPHGPVLHVGAESQTMARRRAAEDANCVCAAGAERRAAAAGEEEKETERARVKEAARCPPPHVASPQQRAVPAAPRIALLPCRRPAAGGRRRQCAVQLPGSPEEGPALRRSRRTLLNR